jgi:general secretion pathway protein A
MLGPFSSFFELRDNPFRANPDPRYLFLTQQTSETLDQIIAAIRARKGLLLLTGEVGTGKTVLLNRLMEWLEQERIPKAFIFNSHLKASELLDLILADFAVPFNAQRGTPLAHLHSWLQDRHCAGQTPVLFVDEAQGLSRRTLEELRMLLNLQTAEGSLLQIVLCGQPEFEETLNRPELRQLRQRIALRCHTAPLTVAETQGYIAARLRVAGGSSAAIFHPEAVQALWHYSRGLPRVLNALCEESLTRAARENIRPVPGRMVGEAAHELQYDEIRPFVPLAAPDPAALSGVFGHLPGFLGTPEIFAAAAPLAQEAPFAAQAPKARGIPVPEPQLFVAAAAASASPRTPSAHLVAHPSAPEPVPAASRISHAPIAFPLPSHHPSPPSPASDEIIACLASASQTAAPSEPRIVARTSTPAVIAPHLALPREVPKKAAKKEDVFRDRWSQRRLAVTNRAQSALSAIAAASGICLVQLQARARALAGSVSLQLSRWRNKNWNVSRTSFRWSDLASSCLHWLRSPSSATRRHHASPNAQVHAPRTQSSAHSSAAEPLRTGSLPRAGGSKGIGSLKQTPSVSSAILHWLQEPSQFVREHKPPRSASTHLP